MRVLELLFSLPPELVGSAVLSKLSVLDIVQLDSACVEKKYRSELFLSYQSTNPLDLQFLSPSGVNEDVLRWLFKRRILVGDVVIHGAELATSQLLGDNVERIRGELTLWIDTSFEPLLVAEHNLSIALEPKFRALKVGQNCNRVPESMATTARLPFRNLRSIASSEKHLSNECLVPLIADNPMLNTIEVRCRAAMPVSIPLALCQRGDTLRTLKLSCADITDEQLQAIAHSCMMLTDFQLTTLQDERVTEVGISAIIRDCASLERINVRLYNHPSLTSALMATALLHGIRLTHIYIEMALLDDYALLQRASSGAPLRELSCCWGVIAVDTVMNYGGALSALHELDIGDVDDASSTSLCAALERMPQLRSLTLCNLSLQEENKAAVLNAVAQGCVGLTKLAIRALVPSIGEGNLVRLVSSAMSAKLLELEIFDHEGVTDAVVLALAAHCPNLHKLLISANCVTDAAVTALARGCRKLEQLCIRDNGRLTDDSVLALAAYCSDLTDLDMECVRHVTDISVMALAHNCRKLRSLHFLFNSHLTDASVLTLSEHCRDLRCFTARHCRQIQESAVVHLVHRCRKLANLIVANGCLSAATAAQLQAQRPGLTVVS